MTGQHMTAERAAALIAADTEEICAPELCGDPLVSVRVITYNQASFIRQALDGVYLQETAFPLEVVIGDDHSTDGTTEIVLEYQRRYPEKTRVLLAKENLGRHGGNGRLNFIRSLQACRGKYVALLEGDDYWTDPGKIRKQVEFLDAHAECVLCCHPVLWQYEDTPGREHLSEASSTAMVDVERILSGEFVVHTCSTVLRRASVECLPEWFFEAPVADLPFLVILRQKGLIGYLDAPMGHYRVHAGGVWQTKSGRFKVERLIPLYKRLRDEFPQYRKVLEFRLAEDYCHLLGELKKDGAHDRARAVFLEAADLLLRVYTKDCLSASLLHIAQRSDHDLWAELESRFAASARWRALVAPLRPLRKLSAAIAAGVRKRPSSVREPLDRGAAPASSPRVPKIIGTATTMASALCRRLVKRRAGGPGAPLFAFSEFRPEQASLTDEEAVLLKELVEQANQSEGPIVEIGTLLGVTTSRMALWKTARKKIITVDNYSWNAWGLPPHAHRALATQLLCYLTQAGHVDQVCADKADFFAKYAGPPPSLVFLDAWHTYEETKRDIQWAKRAGAQIISGHDYKEEFPGVVQIVNELGGPARLRGSLWVL